ncbi:MAG: hypothetical protein WDN45_14115 [Caulobacteraceae bacterium]
MLKAATQQHHRELERAFRPYVAKDAVVFDVGAHAGQFSKLSPNWRPRAGCSPSSPRSTLARS